MACSSSIIPLAKRTEMFLCIWNSSAQRRSFMDCTMIGAEAFVSDSGLRLRAHPLIQHY